MSYLLFTDGQPNHLKERLQDYGDLSYLNHVYAWMYFTRYLLGFFFLISLQDAYRKSVAIDFRYKDKY